MTCMCFLGLRVGDSFDGQNCVKHKPVQNILYASSRDDIEVELGSGKLDSCFARILCHSHHIASL